MLLIEPVTAFHHFGFLLPQVGGCIYDLSVPLLDIVQRKNALDSTSCTAIDKCGLLHLYPMNAIR